MTDAQSVTVFYATPEPVGRQTVAQHGSNTAYSSNAHLRTSFRESEMERRERLPELKVKWQKS